MGCGRVGSSLAHSLENQGHDVAIIDQEESAFRRLGSGFEGRRVTGVGFDRDTLRAKSVDAGFVDVRFTTAYEMHTEVGGRMRTFPIFLMVAVKA